MSRGRESLPSCERAWMTRTIAGGCAHEMRLQRRVLMGRVEVIYDPGRPLGSVQSSHRVRVRHKHVCRPARRLPFPASGCRCSNVRCPRHEGECYAMAGQPFSQPFAERLKPRIVCPGLLATPGASSPGP